MCFNLINYKPVDIAWSGGLLIFVQKLLNETTFAVESCEITNDDETEVSLISYLALVNMEYKISG